MIYCDLAGKNRVSEDVFTSNCLGLLELLGEFDVLGFFSQATNADREPLVLPERAQAGIALRFWPYLPFGGIPDAIIELAATTPFRIVVEVKHGAPAGSDQLARYRRAAERLYPGQCAVVYLTHHRTFPTQDIILPTRDADSSTIFWLSWYHLSRWVDMQLLPHLFRSATERRILERLRAYLAAYGYRVFRGWEALQSVLPNAFYRRCYLSSVRKCNIMSLPYNPKPED